MVQAVIIAAGKGNRLRKENGRLPKPLYSVAGLPIIERVILSAKKAGISEFVIVIGWAGERIQRWLEGRQKKLGVRLQFVVNPEWERANGFSLLKAKDHLRDDFVLLMSDHIFDWKILENLLKRPPAPDEMTLGVDRRLEEIFDETDATKVRTEGDRIRVIGKEIGPYDAIDTGLFYCSPLFLKAVEKSCREGNGSISEAVQAMAAEGKGKIFDIGNRYWQDVDTPEALKEAERILFQAARKPATDGFVSSLLNRKISGVISRMLIRLPVTPNQITFSSFLIGLLSSFLISRADYPSVALGGLLFQFASIYDGCDGEVAKIKMAQSKLGEWMDTVSDNLTYLAFFGGVLIASLRQGIFPHTVSVGISALTGIVLSMFVMAFYLIRYTTSGSFVTVQQDLTSDIKNRQQPSLGRLFMSLKFLVKRDFFAFLFMILCLFNKPHWILVFWAIGANALWLTLLFLKKEFTRARTTLQPQD
ncbi:MAG: NTP transferase domain-containing protein [Deltaproteobacteria bacterium]|nr:NTP transferase domain-containing protein [Deltaproteobacteria bacterium]